MNSILKQSKSVLDALVKAYEKARDTRQHPEKVEHPITPHHHGSRGQTMTVKFDVYSVVKATFAITAILLLFYFLYTIEDILVLLFVSIILSTAINPLVDFLESYGWSRALGVLLIFAVLIVVLGTAVYSVIPIIVEQVTMLSKNIGELVNRIVSGQVNLPLQSWFQPYVEAFARDIDLKSFVGQLENVLSSLGDQLASIAGNSFAALAKIFNGLLNAFLVMFLAFFMVTGREEINRFAYALLPHDRTGYVRDKARRIQERIGQWVRGQLLLCVIVGLMVYFGLWILEIFGIHIAYKETLAVLAGTMEIVPYVGFLFGLLPALLIAANVSFTAFIVVLLLYLGTQFIQNNIVSPLVMERELGLNPIVIITAVLIGAKFFGVLGIVLAIPVTTSLSVFVESYIERRRIEGESSPERSSPIKGDVSDAQ